MSTYLDHAEKLRAATDVHYNCAQSVLIPFAVDANVSEETAFRTAANFGGGMKMGGTCGAITGGLMALGLYGIDDGPTISAYLKALRDNHDGMLDCKDLLRVNKAQGRAQKPHCDEMVYECAALVEKILKEQGKLPDEYPLQAEI